MFSRKKFENPYLQGNYAPVTSSLHQTELPCRGTLPADLFGLFVRNGPNPMTPPKASKHHWFVGDGMLHGIRFEQGRTLWYRNQPVSANGSTANTHVIGHAGNLYALVEAGGAPVKVDDQLNSLDEPAFENTHRYLSGCCQPGRDLHHDHKFRHHACRDLAGCHRARRKRTKKQAACSLDHGRSQRLLSVEAEAESPVPVSVEVEPAASLLYRNIFDTGRLHRTPGSLAPVPSNV